MKFNEKLITLRKEKGLSQEELGDILNVARQTVSKWELGETTPEMDKLIKMSEVFEISLDELVKDTDVIANSNNSNTQRLAGLIITMLKIIGIGILVCIVLAILSAILFSVNTNEGGLREINSSEEIIIQE